MRSPKICIVENCEDTSRKRDMCPYHYNLWREQNASICSVLNCADRILARDYCGSHYRRWKKYGDPQATLTSSEIASLEKPGWKYCRTCKEVKPEDSFYVRIERSPEHLRSRCVDCTKKYWHDNRDDFLAQKAANNYGISTEKYNELMSSSCHICGSSKQVSNRRLHIDHCHKTGVVRGVLCHSCNTALGLLNEDPSRLRSMLEYLEKASAEAGVS